MKGSYQLDNFTENKAAEVERLKSQVELFFDKEFAAFQKLGLKDGMNILECGSGPGYLMVNILKQLPNCTGTALEIDPYLFDILTANSETEGKKLYNPIQGSIYEIDLPDESIDFAVTRLVVEHLQDPYQAFSELRRVLKPNGILVVVSNDFAYHVLTYPVIPELDEMFAAYNKSRFNEGGNPLVGRQLPVFFNKSGFENVQIELTTAHSTLKGDQAMLDAENVNISRSLVREGFLKAETLENLLQKWFEMLQNPDHIIYRQLFIVGGKKDAAASIDFNAVKKEYADNLVKIAEREKSFNSSQNYEVSVSADELETQILNEWKKALNLAEISNSDNFFDIGGSSVMIPEIINSLSEQLGIKLKILDFFQQPTIKSLAEYILNKGASNESSASNGQPIAFKESIRSESNANKFASSEEQQAKLKAQRNKFKTRRK